MRKPITHQLIFRVQIQRDQTQENARNTPGCPKLARQVQIAC